MIEVWRAIVGYPSYEVSNLGRVRSLKHSPPMILKLSKKVEKRRPSKPTYLRIGLKNSAGQKNKRVHRLVLEAFVGPAPSEKHIGAHIDGNSMNNWLENLKWSTQKENEADKALHGTKIFGTKAPNAKLNSSKVRRIRSMRDSETVALTRKSIEAMAVSLGVSSRTVRDVLDGRTWNHIK